MEEFIKQLMKAALDAGMSAAEAYIYTGSSFNVGALKGEINEYSVSDVLGLALRGIYKGKMGYAATEAFDNAAVEQLVQGVIDSAVLSEEDANWEIFKGAAVYPTLEHSPDHFDALTSQDKISACLNLEKAALTVEKVNQVEGAYVGTTSDTIRIVNTYGLDITRSGHAAFAGVGPMAEDDGDTSTTFHSFIGMDFSGLCVDKMGREAAEEAVALLHASPVATGSYPVIIRREAMSSLLATFAGVFSAESAQQGISLLAGREGEVIASEKVTLMDDPLLKDGIMSRVFDAEGIPTRTKAVIENGRLVTLLHNTKTAAKQGVETTGNASKPGYAGAIHVAPTNFFIKAGEKDLDALMAEMKDGLLVMELAGLHSGASPVSGDFSLMAKGFMVKDGKAVSPINQVTIAGNFYQSLKDVKEVGSDLQFSSSGIGCPSVLFNQFSVAGK